MAYVTLNVKGSSDAAFTELRVQANAKTLGGKEGRVLAEVSLETDQTNKDGADFNWWA